MTDNEPSSSLMYSTQVELKSSKAWLDLAHFQQWISGWVLLGAPALLLVHSALIVKSHKCPYYFKKKKKAVHPTTLSSSFSASFKLLLITKVSDCVSFKLHLLSDIFSLA